MKTKTFCTTIFAGILLVFTGYAQEMPLASNESAPAAQAAASATDERLGTDASTGSATDSQEGPVFTLSGSIDTYFHSTFGATNAYYGGMHAPASAFADLKGFGLGMANVVASYSGDKAGFVADLVFGPRGRAAVFASEQGIVNQLYAYYKVSDKVTFNMGQFNTFVGYEVISPTVNFHYSTSYMFSYGPFSHTGLRADFDLGGGMVAKLAVMNPSDLVEFNPVNTYTLGAQVGHSNDAGGIWLNLLYGDQDGNLKADDAQYIYDDGGNVIGLNSSAGSLFQVDLTGGWNLGETFYLGLNTSYQSVAAGEAFNEEGQLEKLDADATSFVGVALYPKVSLSDAFALGVRAEYFSVANGHLGIFGTDEQDPMGNEIGKGSVMEFTLSANYRIGNLTLIPECRMDVTSEDSFVDSNGKATRRLPSANFAAVYKF